ncbi:YfzA family protein [Paenibacillus lactis]|uniref:YfzA family protein n=1 Tax=Paenibacillus lactis TaxID=228574 RepID=UPI001FC9F1EB|nr:YfzA family protein [Paenibacillus lactis]
MGIYYWRIFIITNILFHISEATGWILNYRDTDGTLFGRILDSFIFTEWFNFYETPQYNLLTVFFGVFFLVPGIISALRKVFSR